MRVLFRVDASSDIGTGHVIRCLTLADELSRRGVICCFICREHLGHLIKYIQSKGYMVYMLPITEQVRKNTSDVLLHSDWLGCNWEEDAEQTKAILCVVSPDWLVIDHYALDVRWEEELKGHCSKIFVIDDLADRSHHCQLLMDQNWFSEQTSLRYEGLVPPHCDKLLGPQYALIKPEYHKLRRLMGLRDGVVRRVLVFMGGSDSGNQTAKVLQALMSENLSYLAVDVVIGVNHPDPQGIRSMIRSRAIITLHYNMPNLAALMARADLMVGAGGATTWERMTLGLPSIVIAIADNQVATNKQLMKNGYLHFIGEAKDLNKRMISDAVYNAINRPSVLRKQSERMQLLVQGDGVQRVATQLLG